MIIESKTYKKHTRNI